MYRRITAGAFAFALVLALVASGGFSAAGVDRDASITVVGDDRAAVGVQACHLPNHAGRGVSGGDNGDPSGNENGGQANRVTPISVEITNRLGAELTVRELTVNGAIVNNRPYAMTIAPHGSERVTVPVRHEASEVTVVVSANGVSTRVTVSEISSDGCPFHVAAPPVTEGETGGDESGGANGGNGGHSRENGSGQGGGQGDDTRNGDPPGND
ncbi:hypothetical protein [Natronomonas salsuginis]|uniref:Uncharacterized protein n=1 Tax=Natronomonas salsuginis TaxID=2217661 RepID=A0A4U5JAR0_9EURY|nr:hypothetical protein [Natronomonas salsuginis]TKR26260.1 hypothetical protein DM868_07140 [Natronomonas salsuginis]